MKDDKPSVEERLDIQELFAKYCWALNTGDADGYVGLFVDGGWVDHKPQGRCQGRAAMFKLLNQIWYGMPHNYLGRQHLPHNFLITRESDGLRARAYWTVNRLEQATNTFYLFIQGDWNALCVNDRSGWKFRELTVTHWYRETAPWVGDPEARMKRHGDWG
jgi:SnoaL-like domain